APNTIIVAGFAGLVAGAISMALGEYTSVRTQTEQVAAEVAKERRELERNPEVETEELAHMWMARGVPGGLAPEGARAAVRTRSRGRAGGPHQPGGGAAGACPGGAGRRSDRAAEPVDSGDLV